MAKIPPEPLIRCTLQSGSVFYYKDDSFVGDEPHYFVVLNQDPANDDRLVLTSATSRLDKARERTRSNPVTLVIVDKGQCPDFSQDSAFEGDGARIRTIGQLAAKVQTGEVMRVRSTMPVSIVQELRRAVLASRQIPGEVRRLIDPSWSGQE